MSDEPMRWPLGHRDLAPLPTVAELLAHARRYCSDAQIATDADALLDAASSDDDRAAVRRYVRLRRSAEGYRPGDPRSNNHGAIAAHELAALAAGLADVERRATCASCGERFAFRRSTARYCSARCSKRAQRAA